MKESKNKVENHSWILSVRPKSKVPPSLSKKSSAAAKEKREKSGEKGKEEEGEESRRALCLRIRFED